MPSQIYETRGVRFENDRGMLRVEQGRMIGNDEVVQYSVLIPIETNASLLELQERAMRHAAQRLMRIADDQADDRRGQEAGPRASVKGQGAASAPPERDLEGLDRHAGGVDTQRPLLVDDAVPLRPGGELALAGLVGRRPEVDMPQHAHRAGLGELAPQDRVCQLDVGGDGLRCSSDPSTFTGSRSWARASSSVSRCRVLRRFPNSSV